MCGRYYVDTEESIANMREIIDAVNRRHSGTEKLAAMKTGEIFPTNYAPVVSASGADIMKWGFPFRNNAQTVINARSETAAQKPMFGAALRERRIAVPTSGFFEWSHVGKKAKDKFLFTIAGEPVLYLAGVYGSFAHPDGTRDNYYAILTTAANESMLPYHNRMPVCLRPGEIRRWIDDPGYTLSVFKRPEPTLKAFPVTLQPEQLSML